MHRAFRLNYTIINVISTCCSVYLDRLANTGPQFLIAIHTLAHAKMHGEHVSVLLLTHNLSANADHLRFARGQVFLR